MWRVRRNMASIISSSLTLVLVLMTGYCCMAKEFRFDYEFNEQAPGWLKYHAVPATWDEARMRCHAEGAVLASPLTNRLKAAIISFVKKQNNCINEQGPLIFSGVHATYSRGDYSSIEGVPLLRLAVTWAPGEPDNYDNSESCLVMRINTNGTMADVRCGDVLPYVCYKKDTDLTMTECGTTDLGYVLDHVTGSCYKFHTRSLVWSEAYMTCVAEGGYLAIINSEAEAAVVREIFKKHPEKIIRATYPNELAIGFRDWGLHHNFMTIHGETLDAAGYQMWMSGQPNNVTNSRLGDQGQFCGSIHRDDKLNDLPCNAPTPFLCEKNPNSLR